MRVTCMAGAADHPLDMRFGLSNGAAPPQITCPDALRNGSFTPCSFGRALFERLGILTLMCHWNGFMVGLGTEWDLTRIRGGIRPLHAHRASEPILPAALSPNDMGSGFLLLKRPFPTGFGLRAGHDVPLPTDDNVTVVKALDTACLPLPLLETGPVPSVIWRFTRGSPSIWPVSRKGSGGSTSSLSKP